MQYKRSPQETNRMQEICTEDLTRLAFLFFGNSESLRASSCVYVADGKSNSKKGEARLWIFLNLIIYGPGPGTHGHY